MKYKYILFTFDGDVLPIAKKLVDEGQDVWVCQIKKAEDLKVKSWISDEKPEEKRRRLMLYDGILEKHDLKETLVLMEKVKDKDKGNYFVIFGFNSLCKISEYVLKLGFYKGLFPTTEDYEREKERQDSKNFVKKNYPDLIVSEVEEFGSVDNAISFIQKSDKLWCVKSDGNFGETIVPDKDDLEMGKQQVIGELRANKKDYNKGMLLLEEKIPEAIEFSPQMVFWNGEPVYSQVELETRMFGSSDIGPQTGGNENIVIQTELNCRLNNIAFPNAMRKIAKKHVGLFIADAGILSDGTNFYFTEFAGNRWGWGGIFSELSAAHNGEMMASNYFEKIAEGKSPYESKFGSGIAIYSLKPDPKIPEIGKDSIPIFISEDYKENVFLCQCKIIKNDDGEDQLVSVGYRGFDDGPLGYVVGRGDTLEDAIESIYETLDNVSFKGLYYRPQSDFLSDEYCSSILNRYRFLIEKELITDDWLSDSWGKTAVKPQEPMKGWGETSMQASMRESMESDNDRSHDGWNDFNGMSGGGF